MVIMTGKITLLLCKMLKPKATSKMAMKKMTIKRLSKNCNPLKRRSWEIITTAVGTQEVTLQTGCSYLQPKNQKSSPSIFKIEKITLKLLLQPKVGKKDNLHINNLPSKKLLPAVFSVKLTTHLPSTNNQSDICCI
jgi:hypothetical protein